MLDKRPIAVLVFLLAFTGSAYSIAEYKLSATEKWFDQCTSYVEKQDRSSSCVLLTKLMMESFYSGYTMAGAKFAKITDSKMLIRVKPYCFDNEQDIDVYINTLYQYVQENPKIKRKLPATLLFNALSQKFPC